MNSTPTIERMRATGQWNPLWEQLSQWDPAWTELFLAAATSAWRSGVLPVKTVELICVAGDAVCTHLYAPGTRRHIRAALDAGASRDEILEVLKLVSLVGLQACHLATPILEEELGGRGDTPATELLQRWDPAWAGRWAALAASVRHGGVLDPKTIELICIAVNASATHMFEPAVRHHIEGALAAGASREEILEVLKLASTVGIHACNLGVPILADELAALRPASAA